ncbi:ABC transporter substrate-binding protein [Mycobacterium antarcticum]|uniref:ABC transporter substrate-binding protein n=1 Tax=Mycolicibacterium sp. TUM20983 TaxID=3023369 RepID=UPI00239C5CD0|nr:ABC transporter substrate-binding protein [Mycolicibacterium sp. TUM20983]GLP77346.1 ABC transporter substrate-binding protein [Mycolicibacterium sp. TUM20983]
MVDTVRPHHTPTGWDRRTFLKAGGLAVGGLSLASLIAACGGGGAGSGSQSGTLTLRLPFLNDMQIPDPDIMYEGEGALVTQAAYEGLARYKPGSPEVIGNLAKSWTISPDQMTYTFTLQPGVKFHDGTPADAAAWIKSFERRLKVNQGPAYMLAGVVDTAAPDPTTLVVTLAEPNNAFLHYLACPWQPFAVSPTAVAKNAVGDDLAQEWLKTHDAGTGPYMISEFAPGSHYTLTAFPDYWGGKPAYESIRIDITPDITTQKLQFDSGAFGMVAKGFPVPDVLTYQGNPKFQVINSVGGVGDGLLLNPNSGIFADVTLRRAMLTAIDRAAIVDTAWGGLAKAQTAMWSEGSLPPALAPFPTTVDTAPLKALVAGLPSKKVDMAWISDGGAARQQMAELVQSQLAAVGLDVTLRTMQPSEQFDLVNQPGDKRPDLMMSFVGGDTFHLDTTFRIMFRTGAAPLNYYQYSNPKLDEMMDAAVLKPTTAEMNAVYQQMSQLMLDEAIVIPMCMPPTSAIAQSDITGIETNSFFPQIVRMQGVKQT